MKMSDGIQHEGIVVGNVFDKYGSRNPIVRAIMQGFEANLAELVALTPAKTIHEVGCGEGFHSLKWKAQGKLVTGSDFSPQAIELAKFNASEQGLSPDIFRTRSIYELEPGIDAADLMVCCEVLEHLEFPEMALGALSNVATSKLIFSVPREPIWRILNISRGKYFNNLGNTPGHIQHWSKKGFIQMISRFFEIDAVRTPIPWTMLLCSVRH